jgi:hypothetical protein
MTWLLCGDGEVPALAPSAADRDALESEAGTGGPGFWAGYWQHRRAYDRADIDTARYWTQVLGHAPEAPACAGSQSPAPPCGAAPIRPPSTPPPAPPSGAQS